MTRDLAAIPTSMSLTLWDALPIFLSVTAAVAIFASVLLQSHRQVFAVETFRRFGVGGIVYLIAISPTLALPWALLSLAGGFALLAIDHRPRTVGTSVNDETSSGSSTWQLLRSAVGDTFWQVLIAAVMVATYEHVLRNLVELNSGLWALLLGFTAALFKLRPGPVAVIGATFALETGAWLTTALVLLPVYVSEVVAARYPSLDFRTVRRMLGA